MENNHYWKDGNAQMDTNLQSFIQENLSKGLTWSWSCNAPIS